MRKVELRAMESNKYEVIKKLIDTNGNISKYSNENEIVQFTVSPENITLTVSPETVLIQD